MCRHLAPLLIAIGLLASAPAAAQTTEHEDIEIIRAPALPAAPEKAPDVAAVVKRMVETTNDFRANENRPRVTVNPKLTAAVTRFAATWPKRAESG